jgi:hypothetical protein
MKAIFCVRKKFFVVRKKSFPAAGEAFARWRVMYVTAYGCISVHFYFFFYSNTEYTEHTKRTAG